MITLSAGTRIWLAAGVTDMRAGMNGLAVKAQTALAEDPFSGHVFVFRGGGGAVTCSRCYGGVVMACACYPSGLSAAASSGRRPLGSVALTQA